MVTVATELQAGPEMDAEVARRVFGVNAWTESDFHGPHQDAHTDQSEMFPTGWLPRFSDSITAAWLVVEKMRDHGWNHFDLEQYKPSHEYKWIACLGGSHVVIDSYGTMEDDNVRPHTCHQADTAPLAICRAALAALDSES
jgi:hypothetical protein